MSKVYDIELQRIAAKKYPDNYSMQITVYNEQAAAKEFMLSVPNNAAKEKAEKAYPEDYTMQKYIYQKGVN